MFQRAPCNDFERLDARSGVRWIGAFFHTLANDFLARAAADVAVDGRVRNLRRQYGNMILSRWPIASTRSWPLTKYPVHRKMNDQSIIMEAVIAAPDGIPQLDRRRPTMPETAILVGDFNMEPSAPEYARIVGRPDPVYGRMHGADRLADALTVGGMAETAGVTFPAKDGEPAQRIDHCFVSYDLVPRVKRGWIDEDAEGSDHQPVWAEFEPPAATS